MSPAVSVSVRSARASPSDRRWIGARYRDYLDDLSERNSGLFPMLHDAQHGEPDPLERWFADRSAFPLVILRRAERVGFAMVLQVAPSGPARIEYQMAEFFIERACRRLGIGRDAAQIIFQRFAGVWEIVEHASNSGAVNFWRHVVSACAGARYQERAINGEVRQVFDSRRARPG